MYKRFNQLSFVIGLFFFIVSLILFANALFNNARAGINIYTAVIFFIFGLLMIFIKNKNSTE
ncbi:MAG: hypothetical protein JWM28_3721 [Chitinophagaceae bacterium]|nr:hypothetical protein [Chitinophagaceae bacterium]